jgi:two-component system response regulator DesR
MTAQLLLAEDDERLRALVAERVRLAAGPLRVLEAGDGAEAVRIGLQQRPHVALLDVQMPRLGGIEAAVTLRDLRPSLHVALFTADPHPHRLRAHELGLRVFDKRRLDDAIDWVATQVEALDRAAA